MDKQPQQQGYIITRHDLEEFYDSLVHVCGKEYADNMWIRIESHPYQSERNTNPICGSAGCLKIIKPHETKVARVERDKVLDEVRTRLSKLKTAYPTGADFVWWLVIDTALKELRQAGER
jgi:hypothetical protein